MRLLRYILIAVSVLLPSGGLYIILSQDMEKDTRLILLSILLFSSFLVLGYLLYFRLRFVKFTDTVCRCTETILQGGKIPDLQNQETLTSKMVTELEKVDDVLQFRLKESESEKAEVQKTISEITHQLKTPLANIRMYQDMISEPDADEADIAHFTQIIRQQLEKLEFLTDSLIKSSRLESEMIHLNMENTSIFQTLTISVNGIIQKAEQKKIELTIDCRPSIYVLHDTKWTAEAIGNILDNAVKYTPARGKILVTVSTGEMFTQIQIEDTGKGIAPEHYNDIFKRFYREKSASRTEGLGLGLYLARNIISLQGGYISVKAAVGEGSCFSIYLPNKLAVQKNNRP